MKRIIRLTESDLARIVKRVMKENEEDWISQSEDIEWESDFGKIDLEKKALKQAERATNILSDDEKNILIDFLNSVGPSEFQDLVSDEMENMGVGAITENEKDDLGMSEEEYQVRKIIDKVLRRVPVIATLGVVPAAMFVGGGLAIGLGALGLAGMLLKDVAWWRPKGYDKDQSSIYHKAADRARYEDGEGRDPYINEMFDDDYYDKDMEGDDYNEDMDPISQFTPEELDTIHDTVYRLSQPGFFEEDEAESYLFYTVANKDENLYNSLVDWLERNGLDNPRLRHGYR